MRTPLIYIDPPFATGADFSFTAKVPDDPNTEGDQSATFVKQPSILEQKAYRDTWGKGLDSFLQWFYETAVMLRELLTEDGSIYVHCDSSTPTMKYCWIVKADVAMKTRDSGCFTRQYKVVDALG